MKSYLSIALSSFLLASTSLAAAPYTTPSGQPWTGLYAGINAGYSWGTDNAVRLNSIPLSDVWANNNSSFITSNCTEAFPYTCSNLVLPRPGLTGVANSGSANVLQAGFVGGVQLGYNYQVEQSSVVAGIETDMQGAVIRGNGGYFGGAGEDSYSTTYSYPDGSSFTIGGSRRVAGFGAVSAGVDWFGTVRGRLGFLVTPSMLIYGTGGLAYGGVHASGYHAVAYTQGFGSSNAVDCTVYACGASSSLSRGGISDFSTTRVGWAAGGGFEWMFVPGTSLKLEAIYFDLGHVSVASTPNSILDSTGALVASNSTFARVQYSNVMARAGISYHFNWP